jgi:hypothetical protein
MGQVRRGAAGWLVSVAVVGCSGGGGAQSQAEAAARDSAKAVADSAKAEESSKTLRVTNVMIGKHIGEGNRVTEPTFQFAAKETVYVSIGTVGSPEKVALSAHFSNQKGEVVDSVVKTIQPKGRENTELHAARPKGWTPGTYRITVYADGDSVDSKTFAVQK